MEPRPFRCVHDPELAKASGSAPQGPKAVFTRPKGARTTDPRRRGPASRGKRAVPKNLPAANFAKRAPRDARVHLTDLGPFVTRTQVTDAARFFGEVKSCDMAVARSTNASLGVASVVFDGEPAIALRAAEQICAACSRGALSIGGVRGARAALDPRQDLWRQAEADAASDAAPVSQAASDTFHRPPSPPPEEVSVNLVELRTLTNVQIDEWYRRFIGPKPTYVLIPAHNVSPLECSVKEVAHRFKDHDVLRIAVNRTGFFVLFESTGAAERCFASIDGKRFMNTRLRLALTLQGERIANNNLRALRQRLRQSPDAASSPHPSTVSTTPKEAPRWLSADAQTQAGEASVDAILTGMKHQAWERFVRYTVAAAVRRALEERRHLLQRNADDAVAPVTPESESSEPEGQFTAAFVSRRMMREVGKTSRPLPAVRMRKRTPEPLALKPQKVVKREPVAPKTYIRDSGARELKRARGISDLSGSELESDGEEEDPWSNKLAEERNGKAQDSPSQLEGNIEKTGISEPESDESDESPFLLPESPPPEELSVLDFKALKGLVRSPEDFSSLQTVLHLSEHPPVSEAEVRAGFGRKKAFKLTEAPINWPAQSMPFREAPFKLRTDDERRSYLPVAEYGRPNEIVQNYRYRPLYEGQEDEDDSSKLELRKDARVLSRSSFGVGSDLFADDTLSKNVKDVRLARSSIHDWGLYANEHIPEGEFVIEYVGDVLRDEYADVRERNYMMEGIDSSYLFRLDNGTVIDATKRGNGARFINHSCDPNCIAQVFDHDGFKRVVLFSVRDIQPDEELAFDYNFVRAQDDEGKVRCACGAANCRGWLI